MKLTRTAGIGAAVVLLAGGGLVTAAVAREHSATAHSATRADPGATAGMKAADGSNVAGVNRLKSANQPGATYPGSTEQPGASVPALTPAQVKYEHKCWGDPKTEVGVVVWAPKGWKMVKLSTFEAKFTSANNLWNVRVNASAPDKPLQTMADTKVAVLQRTTGFHLISRVNGTTKATNPNFTGITFHHTTLTYSYTDSAHGTRLVVDRFVAVDDTTHALFEISTGGRPQDRAALTAITAKVTEDFIRLP